jgi:hypothetical protein
MLMKRIVVTTDLSNDSKAAFALHFNEIPCEVAVRDAAGSVPSEIVKFAKEQHADLLVLSSHGRGGLSRLIIGSITEQVARESSCPVLIVPPQSASTETPA